jgi:hypothetical protein
MMVCVMCRAIDKTLQAPRHPKVAIVNRNCPKIDQHEHEKVNVFVHGEEEYVEVVREALGEAVDGMKGMGGKGSGYFPKVMCLVETLVEET